MFDVWMLVKSVVPLSRRILRIEMPWLVLLSTNPHVHNNELGTPVYARYREQNRHQDIAKTHNRE